MAVSVDSVYQKVLALANKEQRGYITPLEFNLLANQAQLDIFQQYFHDLNQQKRIPGDTGSISDIPEHIRYKILDRIVYESVTDGLLPNATLERFALGKVFLTGASANVTREVRKVSQLEARNILDSQFHREGLRKNPIYHTFTNLGTASKNRIVVYGENSAGNITSITNGGAPYGVMVEAVVVPGKVEWGYDVIEEKALYNAGRSANFRLHQSEEPELVIKILELAGIILNKPGLVSIADQEGIKTVQQEKQ